MAEAHEAGDEEAQNVYTVMWAATSLFLKDPANISNPFCPMLVGPEFRTAELNDFTDEHIAVFRQLLPKIQDSDLLARIADIVWVRKRDYQVAEQAVSAYLESARRLEDMQQPWPSCLERIRRAVTLSVLHGRNGQMFKQAIAHIEETLERHRENDPSYLSAELMAILLKQKVGDSTKYVQLSEWHAKSAEEDEDWHRPKTYWELQARWLELANDDMGSRAARIREAERYERAAKDLVNRARPDYLTGAEVLKSAIQAFKRIGGESERIEKLHRNLLEFQRKGLGQMGLVSAETSIEEPYRDAINSVKGKPLSAAIHALARISVPPKLESLRQDAEQLMQELPLLHLIPWFQEDASGRTTGFAPSSLSEDADDRDASIRSHLLRSARNFRSLVAEARIKPARRQILQEHNVREENFAPIVANNPLVSDGRIELYTRGLHAGLEGDFVVATHMLIPQLENSLRHVLTKRGVITSGLDAKGIQDVHLLGSMLYRCEVKSVFGEDVTFDLQGLLVERFGSNLRNEVAHGLMDREAFFSTDAIYLWWLTLHLLVSFQSAHDSQADRH